MTENKETKSTDNHSCKSRYPAHTPIIIIIMVIFKCYFSGEHIALSIKIKQKNNNNGVNIELGKTNRLKALCMMQINT